MAINFPASLDTDTTDTGTLPQILTTDTLNSSNPNVVHHVHHSNLALATIAMETKIGAHASSDAASIDYLIRKGAAVRNTAALTTVSLGAGATDSTQTLATGFGCLAIKIQTSAAAWVRIYSDTASQTADSSRLQTVDPTSGTGVLLEVITTGAQTIVLSPSTALFNSASGISTIPTTVTNLSGVSQGSGIIVTVTFIPNEGTASTY
jgi:hypothetical protein